MTNKSYKLAIIFIELGAIAISYSYLLGYKGEFNYTFFWIGILLAIIPTLMVMLSLNSHTKILVLLFLLGLLLYLPIIFWSPEYFRFTDEILHLNSIDMILEKGNLDIDPILEVSKYYPGIEFLAIFFMKFSDLPLFTTGKLLMGIIHSMILVFIYLSFNMVTSSQKIAVIGSMIYAANPGYIFFDALFSYETMGILLMIALIYYIYMRRFSNDGKNNENNNKKIGLSIISIITLFALIISHPFSSYMFSIFLISAFVIYYIYKTGANDAKKDKYTLKYTILTILLIVAWIIYFAQMTTRYFGNMISLSFSSISSFLSQGTAQRQPFRLTTLPQYEILIDKYIYIPLLFLLFVYCIYLLKKNSWKIYEDKDRNSACISLILYGSLFFFSLPLIFTSAGKLFMYRSWSFIFIGLSFSVAIVLEKLFNKRDLIIKIPIFISVILIIMGGISIGSSSSYRDPNYIDAAFPSSVTLDVVRASEWFDTHFGNRNVILGDITIYTVFGGYGRQYVQSEPYLFYKQTMDSESESYLMTNFSGNFIVTDNRITKKLSSFTFYFDSEEVELEDRRWGYIEPLPIQNIMKFDMYESIYRIYDNGNIFIYYIDRWR